MKFICFSAWLFIFSTLETGKNAKYLPESNRNLLEIFDCPASCGGNGCTCDSNCKVCNNNVCSQCVSGYFKKDDTTACVECHSVFGSQCMFCQDYNGCGQCEGGYQRIHDASCDLWHCLGATDPATVDCENTLEEMIDYYQLSDEYSKDFVEYVVAFDKLSSYCSSSCSGDGDGDSRDYSELKSRYESYVENTILINDGNDNFWSRASTFDGMTESALANGVDPDDPRVYAHNEFSDWSDAEIRNLLGHIDTDDSTSDTRRIRRLQEDCDDEYTVYGYDINVIPSGESDLKRYAPAVVSQGGCGSCWAFASTAQFEINYNQKAGRTYGNVAKFSEEYLIDCASYCESGCDVGTCRGGQTALIPSFLMREGHCIHTGYEGGGYNGGDSDRSGCEDCESGCKVFPNFMVTISPTNGDADSLLDQFKAAQTATYVNGRALQFSVTLPKGYIFLTNDAESETGVIWWGDNCTEDKLLGGHAMVVMGQKIDSAGGRFLLVRNSWGTNFGDDGYVWMSQFVATSACKPRNYMFNAFEEVCYQSGDFTFCDTPTEFDWLPSDNDRCEGVPNEQCTGGTLTNCRSDKHADTHCAATGGYTSGCPVCDSGYFAFDDRYKCQECADLPNCSECDADGCSVCTGGYVVVEGCPVNYCQVVVF